MTTVERPQGRRDSALVAERRLLRLSTACAAAFGVLGLAWGWLADSQVILLDGAYALIGLLLSILTLRAATLVERGATTSYPFGREALAPLVVGVSGMVLLGTFGFAALDAIAVMIDGGNADTAVGSALVYAVVSLVLTLVLWWTLRGRARGSELVASEAAQWAAGWVLNAAMILGFTVALVLQSTGRETLAGFVDPVLVLVATAIILPTPVGMLRSMYHELMEGAPEPEVAEPAHRAIDDVTREFDLAPPTVRLGKMGRKLYIELDYLVAADRSVGDADLVRRRLIEELAEPGRLLWVNVELHTDPAWDR